MLENPNQMEIITLLQVILQIYNNLYIHILINIIYKKFYMILGEELYEY